MVKKSLRAKYPYKPQSLPIKRPCASLERIPAPASHTAEIVRLQVVPAKWRLQVVPASGACACARQHRRPGDAPRAPPASLSRCRYSKNPSYEIRSHHKTKIRRE